MALASPSPLAPNLTTHVTTMYDFTTRKKIEGYNNDAPYMIATAGGDSSGQAPAVTTSGGINRLSGFGDPGKPGRTGGTDGTSPNVIKQPSQKLDAQNKKTLLGFLAAAVGFTTLAGLLHFKENTLGEATKYFKLPTLFGALLAWVIAIAGLLTGESSRSGDYISGE